MDVFQKLVIVFCVFSYGDSVTGLLNGTLVTNGQFAAHALLSLPNGQLCGGEIITSAHILTASSCVFDEYNELLAPYDITVTGKWNISTSPLVAELIDLKVTAIYAHPQYNPYSKENDIAVLRGFTTRTQPSSTIFVKGSLMQRDSVTGLLNGTLVTNGQFAAHALLSLPNGQLCGGEIITSAHILTASSCVFDEYNELLAPYDITVTGKWNISTSPLVAELIDLKVTAIYAHPQYNPYSKENDIAVLRLFRDLPLELSLLQPSLSKAELVSRIVADETPCLLSGPKENETTPELIYTQLAVVNRIDCNQNEEYMFGIKEKMICAGSTDENVLCQSDLGSGLYCGGNLAGILTFGAGCGSSYPAVFTQVRMYNAWINNQLKRKDIPKAGPTPPPQNNRSSVFPKSCRSLIFIIFWFVFKW